MYTNNECLKREFLHRLIEARKQAEENMESENEFKMDDDIDFDALEADDIAWWMLILIMPPV